MITTINEFKKTLNETIMPDKNISMTVDELLRWYTGTNEYENELDVITDNFFDSNMNQIDINDLLNNKEQVVEITSSDIGNVIDNEFSLNDKVYSFDSMDYPGEHNYAGSTNENNDNIDWELNNSTATIKFIYPPKSGSLTKLFIDFIYNNPGSTRQDFYKFINREYTPGNNSQFFAGIKDSGILELIGNKYYIGTNYGKWTQGKLSLNPKQHSYPWTTR